MKKIFMTLAVMVALAFTAVDVSAATLQERRNEVVDELNLVRTDVIAERNALSVRIKALPAGTEKDFLRAKRDALNGRIAFLNATRRSAKTSYNDRQLDVLILRFDLAVSLS